MYPDNNKNRNMAYYNAKNNTSTDLGKLPPQSIEMEEAVLGALLVESDSIVDVVDIITPESFYKDSNQKIYYAIISLYNESKGIDLFSVMEKLRSNGHLDEIGGVVFLTELTSKIGSASHIEFHARIIQQKYMQRELIRASSDIIQRAFDESVDVDDIMDYAEGEIFKISNSTVSKDIKKLSEVSKKEIARMEEAAKLGIDITGLETGFVEMDRLLNGLQDSKFIVFGGRPGQGKTTIALQIAINVSRKHKVAFFSLEMGEDEVSQKAISCLTDISTENLMRGNLSQHEWTLVESAQTQIEQGNLYIDDTCNVTPVSLRAKCRRLKMKKGLDLVILDYIQLMGSSNKGNREQEVSNISRSLKLLSKELKIPVIALTQLNRSVEMTPDKKPNLSHIRESGSIEQDSDTVAFIHRPSYYGFTEYEDGSSTDGIMEVLIRKNRGGRIGDIKLKHNKVFSRISNYRGEQIKDVESIPESNNDNNNDDLLPELGF